MAVCTLLAGCASWPGTSQTPQGGSNWILAELPGQALLGEQRPTLRFEEGRLAGSDGCNQYGGAFRLRGERFSLSGDLASTLMACPEPRMRQADAFLAALQAATRLRVEEQRLLLLNDQDRLLAAFAAEPVELVGTRWRVSAVNNGRQAVASVLAGSALTLEFGTDGQATGSAGCNRYRAEYRQSGQDLTFGTPASTRRFCADPAEVMTQESAFLAALESVASARRSGDRLELRADDGSLEISLTEANEATADVDSFLGKLPTTFIGALPCADCPGIRHHLNLWPDSVFHLRREWLDRDGPRDDLGTWRFDPASRTLVLAGGTEMPLQFELLADGRLRLLDLEGRHIESALPYELSDQGGLAEFDLEQFVTGTFIYYADAGLFTECLTGRRYPVAMEADYLALERAYLANAASPGAPLRVSLEITLADRPQADGPGTDRTVIVRRFVGAAPGEQCPAGG